MSAPCRATAAAVLLFACALAAGSVPLASDGHGVARAIGPGLADEVVIDDAHGSLVEALPGTLPAASPGVQLGGVVALPPARLLDTRAGIGAAVGPLHADSILDLIVVGRGGVPAEGVDTVALNVTVTEPTSSSYVTVWPAGEPRPEASNLNMRAGQTVANLVFADVGAGGAVSIYNAFGSTQVIADVVGWSSSDEFLHSFSPSRILDTRVGIGGSPGPVGAGGVLDLGVIGSEHVPVAGVGAVVLNVTATEATDSSFVTVWPAGWPRPLASSLNIGPGETNPNMVVSRVGEGGRISLYNHAGTTHLVVDIVGWMPGGGAYTALDPTRVLDTRDQFGTYAAFVDDPSAGLRLRPPPSGADTRIGPGQSIRVNVGRQTHLPASATTVVLNLTATDPSADTYVTAWKFGAPRPAASSLNVAAGETRPNLVLAEVGEGGYVSLYNHSGSVHLVVDVVGFFEARNVADAPDEAAGPSIHVVHLVPSDVTSTYSDEEVRHTIGVAEDWLSEHGDRGFRFDTEHGVAEISTHHMRRTAAELEAAVGSDWLAVEDWLTADGFGVADKVYLVYLDGVDAGWCGLAGGQIATVFTSSCPGSGRIPNAVGSWSTLASARTTVHEVLHVLGAVSACAGDHRAGGHVDDASDIMSSTDVVTPEGALVPGTRSVLDAGHDDYWGQGNSTCDGYPWVDVSLSPFLDAP